MINGGLVLGMIAAATRSTRLGIASEGENHLGEKTSGERHQKEWQAQDPYDGKKSRCLCEVNNGKVTAVTRWNEVRK